MPKKRYRPEDIITKLREADILISQGKTVAETIRQLGVSDVVFGGDAGNRLNPKL